MALLPHQGTKIKVASNVKDPGSVILAMIPNMDVALMGTALLMVPTSRDARRALETLKTVEIPPTAAVLIVSFRPMDLTLKIVGLPILQIALCHIMAVALMDSLLVI